MYATESAVTTKEMRKNIVKQILSRKENIKLA